MVLPLTGRISTEHFPAFLQRELVEKPPRYNIDTFRKELGDVLAFPQENGVYFCALVNSGSSAHLVAAQMVKELAPAKKRVILPAISFPTTVSAFEQLGFSVQLVDIAVGSLVMDVGEVEEILDEDVAALVPAHFLGFPASLEKLRTLADQCGSLLVQDGCETMNLRVGERSLYTFGDIITHSFYHPHHLSSYGGGAVITSTKKNYDLAESISHWGRECSCHYDSENCTAPQGKDHNFRYVRPGLNVEISELNAAFGRMQFQGWEEIEKIRSQRYEELYTLLQRNIGLTIYASQHNVSPFAFAIGVPEGDFNSITSELWRRGLPVRNLVGGAIHTHPGYQHLAIRSFPHAEQIQRTHFIVGIHQDISEEDFQRSKRILEEVLR